MSIIETTNLERIVLAFRGDTDGAYKGAHVEKFTVLRRDDDSEVARQPGRATTISELAAEGFTWPDVAAAINVGLLLTNEAQAGEITALNAAAAASAQTHTAEVAALNAQVATLTAEKAAAVTATEAAQAQLEAFISPADVSGVPEWVYASQAYKALILAGKFDAVTAALDAAAAQGVQGQLARVDFQKSAKFYRNHPSIELFVQSGLFTGDEVDALFVAAAAL